MDVWTPVFIIMLVSCWIDFDLQSDWPMPPGLGSALSFFVIGICVLSGLH